MAQKKPRIYVKIRPASPLLKVLLIVMILVCTISLLTLRVAIGNTRAETELLRNQAAKLEQQNNQLSQNIAEIGTVQGIKRIASQMLDLVEAGSGFFTPGAK